MLSRDNHLSFSFGLVSAFFQPAALAIIPALSKEGELQGANALMQGGTLIAQAVGPGIAGVVVNAVGVSFAFAFDAFTFLVTSFTLWLIPEPNPIAHNELSRRRGSILHEIGEMLQTVKNDSILRPIMLLAVAFNLFATGPTIIGSAALAKLRFVGAGSSAFGAMLSLFGIGLVMGLAAGGWLRPKNMGRILLTCIAMVGGCIILLAVAPSLLVACVLMLVLGVPQGFLGVLFYSWIQQRVAREMMGRVMSVLGLATVGLTPVSSAIAGTLANISLPFMFAVSGVILIVTFLLATANPVLRVLRI